MTCARASLAVVGGLMWASPALCATPAHEALVIGNGTYETLPSLPACLQSAHVIAMALRGAGFHVTEREDASRGAIGGAIDEFSGWLAISPGAIAVIYSCGYTATFNDRLFLLPLSVNIARPTDILTEGVLGKYLINVIARAGAGPSVVAIDAVPTPDSPGPVGLDVLIRDSLPNDLGMIGVSQSQPGSAPTPLATALVAGLKGSSVRTDALLAGVQQQLAASQTVTVAAQHMPVTPGFLVGTPPPPLQPPQVAAATAPPATAPPAVAATPPAPAPAPPPAIAMPSEEPMSREVRGWVQKDLAKLGYYNGRIDGIFGPDTRAAISRYQHELRADETGYLTAAQTVQLINHR
jgi:hypothetical protein